MTRRLLVFLLLVTLALLGDVAAALWPPSTAITRENAARITAGMNLAEVEVILGGPPRTETTGPCAFDEIDNPQFQAYQKRAKIEGQRPSHGWRSDHVVIFVRVNQAGEVTDCEHFPMRRAPESVFEMFRRRLRW